MCCLKAEGSGRQATSIILFYFLAFSMFLGRLPEHGLRHKKEKMLFFAADFFARFHSYQEH